jgi:hypothetical protein
MNSYRFNLDEWLPRIPLESTAFGEDAFIYSGEIITSPYHLCQNEHLRNALRDQLVWGESVDMDVFVMAKGEPQERHVTKVSGLPYWPSAKPWPTGPKGKPLFFVAQFCFADSQDLTGQLPGDILLIFSRDKYFKSLKFEWLPLGLNDLIQPAAVPTPPSSGTPCYGLICRTKNYPSAEPKPEVAGAEFLKVGGLDVHGHFRVTEYQATQIGGRPFYIQGNPNLPGSHLCTLSSVQPDMHGRYPWVNQEEPRCPPNKFDFDDGGLKIDDMGCIYFSIDDKKRLHYTAQSY